MVNPGLHVTRSFESAVRRALLGPCAFTATCGGPAPLLVAVSGGQDSLALVHAFAALMRGRGAVPIRPVMAHIDHQLRDAAALAADRRCVEGVAARLGFELMVATVDTRAIAAAERCSLEDAARRGRYRELARLAAAAQAASVVTGHTATDQAETVLMRLLHGAGAQGLAGMRYRAPWPVGEGPALLRPLLGMTREETGAYCRALGVIPAVDESNASPRHIRNRIRNALMPALARENPAIIAALNRIAASAGAAADLITEASDRAWPEIVRCSGEDIAIAVAPLLALPAAVQEDVLRRVIVRIGAGRSAAHAPHICALQQLAERPVGAVRQLPGSWRAERAPAQILVRPPAAFRRRWPELVGEWPLALGRHDIPGWRVTCERWAGDGTAPEPGRADIVLRRELLETGATFTARRPGDRIQPAGMRGTRSLQDLLVDAKVPAEERGTIPVLRCGGRVAWVAGVRAAGWALAERGQPGVRVTVERPTSNQRERAGSGP